MLHRSECCGTSKQIAQVQSSSSSDTSPRPATVRTSAASPTSDSFCICEPNCVVCTCAGAVGVHNMARAQQRGKCARAPKNAETTPQQLSSGSIVQRRGRRRRPSTLALNAPSCRLITQLNKTFAPAGGYTRIYIGMYINFTTLQEM